MRPDNPSQAFSFIFSMLPVFCRIDRRNNPALRANDPRRAKKNTPSSPPVRPMFPNGTFVANFLPGESIP
jgi:hypothetical protein